MTASPPKYLTHAMLVDLLLTAKGSRTLAQFSTEVGISQSMMSNIICGYRRADGEAILNYHGVEKVTLYIYKRKEKEKGEEKEKEGEVAK